MTGLAEQVLEDDFGFDVTQHTKEQLKEMRKWIEAYIKNSQLQKFRKVVIIYESRYMDNNS